MEVITASRIYVTPLWAAAARTDDQLLRVFRSFIAMLLQEHLQVHYRLQTRTALQLRQQLVELANFDYKSFVTFGEFCFM